MRKTIVPLTVLLLLAAGCEPEREAEVTPLPHFADISVDIGSDAPGENGSGTRSLISVDAERFRDAYLFAFDAATGKVLTYPEHAGDLEGTGPVAIYTTEKSFNWALPVGTAMDIWAVVNPGSGEIASFLETCAKDPGITESDLYGEKLLFRCESGTRLKALDSSETGIPMSGRMDGVVLQSESDALSVRVRRLFAKYNIHFDTSGYDREGFTVKSTYLMASKSNTEVPFFWDGGYSQTDYSKLATVDRSTEADLEALDEGGQVTLYFLENCQGDKQGASSWSTVYSDLGPDAVKLCSYMEVGVNVSRSSDGTDASFVHRIYLGKTDMTTNFDVERNLFKTLKLFLRPDEGIVPGGDVEGFFFTNTNSLSVAPGESVTVPFETTLSNSEIEYLIERSGKPSTDLVRTGGTYETSNRTGRFPNMTHSGTVTFTASETAAEGTLDVTGGRNPGDVSAVKSTVQVTIQEPVVLDIAYETLKQGEYLGEWCIVSLPEASGAEPVTAAWRDASMVKTISCGGTSQSVGNRTFGAWWDASSRKLYTVSWLNGTCRLDLKQDGRSAATLDMRQRKAVIGPEDGAVTSYAEGVAHITLDNSGAAHYVQIVPRDPDSFTAIDPERFALPSFVDSRGYLPFEEQSLDTSDDNIGDVFTYSFVEGDDGACDLGRIRFYGLEACTEEDGYYLEAMHGLNFADCLFKVTVRDYSSMHSRHLGEFHNTQVATGDDLGCDIPEIIGNNGYEIRRYVYGSTEDVHAQPTEEYWNGSSSAEDCMSVDRSGLHIARISVSEGGRYPCGTYIIRSSVTNPYNHAVRHAYYTFDLILDINIIPNVVMDLTRNFTERIGYYDYRHKVESYRLGLTYHCPMAYKGSTIVEKVFPQVRAKFYYDDPNETGARIIESYTSASEDDYNGPRTAAVDIAAIKAVYLTGTTADTGGDYWTTIGYSNSDMYENVLEVPHTYMGGLFFMWYFNAKGDSTQFLDFLPADKGWKDTQDGGFYHIGKRTDTCIENTFDDGWVHY